VLLVRALSGVAVEADDRQASPAEWRKAIAGMLEVDGMVAAGDITGATHALERLAEVWPPPLDAVAKDDFWNIQNEKGPHPRPVGLELLANAVDDLKDDALRVELEDRILSLDPPSRDAAAAVFVSRGNRAYREDRLSDALRFFVAGQQSYPGSASTAVLVFNQGIVLRDLERYPEAVAVFQCLIDMNVDNREEHASSIMDTGYRNYHFHSAVNLSWCCERMGELDRALQWVRLAQTTYTYQDWCGVEIAGARFFTERTVDRLSWRIGGLTAISRFGGQSLRLWYAWAACGLLVAVLLTPGHRVAAASLPGVVLLVGLGFGLCALVPLATGENLVAPLPYWLTDWWPLRWAAPGALLAPGLLLWRWRPRAAARFGLAALIALTLGQALWCYRWVRPERLARLPFHELQLMAFAAMVPTLALLLASVCAIVAMRRARARRAVPAVEQSGTSSRG